MFLSVLVLSKHYVYISLYVKLSMLISSNLNFTIDSRVNSTIYDFTNKHISP